MAYITQEEKKQRAPQIKAVLKKYGLKGTIGIRDHMTLYVTIKEGALNFIGVAQKMNNEYAEARGIKPVIMDNYDTIHHTHADRYRRFDETIANFIDELDAAMKGVTYYNNMDSFLHNHQAALDSQREAQAIRDVFGDEDDKYFNHEYDYEDDNFFDD